MKKTVLFFTFCILCLNASVKAQFTNPDTVKAWAGAAPQFNAYITNTTSSNIAVDWKVIATDFPSDWISYLSICDNQTCQSNGGGSIWNGSSGNSFHSGEYFPSVSGDFHLVNNFSSVTPGTHWLTVSIKDSATSFTKTTTFIINHPTTGVTTVSRSNDDVTLYPNPVVNDVNVIFSQNAGIRNIAIYDVIGKAVSIFRVTGSSARMDVANLPTGVYFIRLLNEQGNIIATRKFNKQ